MNRYLVLTSSLAFHAEGIYFMDYKVKLLCDCANVRYVFVTWLSYITLNINNLTHLMCGVKIMIRSQWFQDNPLVLKFLVGERYKGWISRPPLSVHSVWGKHLVLASSLAFHAEDVYFKVLQDWTSQFIMVWASTSSWPRASCSMQRVFCIITRVELCGYT